MARRNSALREEYSGFDGDDDDDEFDPEEDAMPAEVLVIPRVVEVMDTGMTVRMEAHITKQPDQDDGVTWLKIYGANSDSFVHCYIDTIDGELILDAIENYIKAGKGAQVFRFLKEEGRAIRNPVTFRLKLDTALGGAELQAAAEDLF